MFSRHRVSRGPEQPTSSSALAAASAIGKALDSNGKTVDRSRLPEYNKAPAPGSRPSSVVVSRRSSILSNRSPGSRNGSLTRGTSPNNSAIEEIRKRTSVGSYVGTSSGQGRSHSLQYSRGPSSRSNSLTNRGYSQPADPKAAFQEFGGQQTPGIIHRPPNDSPKTMKKYIPTSHGLVAVEVPVEAVEQQKRKASSLRRSPSTGSLTPSRNNSLTRRAAPQSNNAHRRHSSLTSHSGGGSKASSRPGQVDDHPLIQTYVVEETEQELSQDIVRPFTIPQDEQATPSDKDNTILEAKKKADAAADEPPAEGPAGGEPPTEGPAQEEPAAAQAVPTVKETELPTTHLPKIAPEIDVDEPLKVLAANKTEPIVIEPSEEKGKVVENNSEDEEANSIEQEIIVKKDTTEPGVTVEETIEFVKQPLDIPKIVKQETNELSEEEMVDASDIVEPEITGTPAKAKESPAPSLAQHLRAVNPYLNQRDTDVSGGAQDSNSEDSKLFKVPSPMKSALKKTTTQSSTSSSMYSEKSPANQAYLSLTTAENTRLNAQLSNAETSVHRQNSKHLTRPASITNPRSISPSPRENTRVKRRSNVPSQVPQNRNSQYKLPNEQTPAVAAARNSSTVNLSRQDSIKKKAQEQVKTVMKSNTGPKQVPESILYPKEPPQKRSSFEKIRNQDSTLGFKKMSLRDERTGTQTEPVGLRQAASYDSGQTFLHNSGWKSRFHDSDSEDESAPFSAGGSRSTQLTSVGASGDNTGGGFAIFKGKNKQNDSAINLAPPQPSFAEQEAVSANSTPSKVNKKWSKLSLRSSSTSDTRKTETAAPEKRYHSNSKLEGFSYDTMRKNQPPAGGELETGKKKNKLGKKLKKLFGRS